MVTRRKVNVRKRRAAGTFIRQFFVGILLTLMLLLIGAAIWYGSRLELFTITTVMVEGGETIDTAAIKQLAEDELAGDYYRVVPKRFAWTYPEARILAMAASQPRVSSASVHLADDQTLIIRVREYTPAALWCPPPEGHDPCVFLDETGYAFAAAPALSGSALFRYSDGQAPAIGAGPFSPAFVKDTDAFAMAMRGEFGFPVDRIEKIGSDEAVFFVLGGGALKASLRQPIADTIDNLRVLLNSDAFRHLRPGGFQYIDLRFGDKIFVNEESGQPDGEVSATSSEVLTR